MTTDTPRTEAARFEALRGAALRQDCIPLKLGQELERELADSKKWLDERYKALSEADERAEKAEAEVERLRSQLNRAVEIADKIWADCSNGSEHTELAALKEEIK
jgi:hypothetical protein